MADLLNNKPGFINVMGEALAPAAAPTVDPNAAANAARAAALKAQTDPLLASLASLDTVLANKNNQTFDEFGRAIQSYDEQDALDKGAFDKNVFNNENSLTSNNQAALLNAANAGTGLKGVLASLGGLAGSGVDVIKRLVGLAANQDTGAARQTFDVNADNLTTSWGQAEREQRQRREDAVATRENSLQNNKAGVLTSKQGIFEQLANAYGAGTAQGNDYAGKAGALAPEIASTTRATVAPYAKASSSFSPTALATYLAGTQNLNAGATANPGEATVPINSTAFNTKKKETLAGVA